MTKTKEPIRKTVYLEEQLVSCAETLFKQAEVDSFSAFVKKAIEAYISKLIFSKNSDILSKEIRKAIREEIYPTNLRLSKGLYKYAIELVSQDAARLEQMIKGVYYPMSIHFEDNISNIEREMREAITSIYIKGLEQFEDIMKDRADCYPTVSEVLKILVYLNNLP